MWTPTHVVVTVLKGRNLLEKGKGGNDAYCMIGMGKEKFLTSVKPKSVSPVWDEQAEFQLGEREDLKITVYHKSSIIDEFIGRVLINVPELATHDNNHSYVSWYKLGGKPEKSEHSKKPEKERGEIEVRIDFVIKPKAGSMMDLSMKSKEHSLSLRNLKDKMNIKSSISEKFKMLKKPGKPKYAGENQLAEQAKRMGGSKLDFLDGDDIGSITSSYSSINGATLNRNTGPISSMSRFNPARQSFISRTSSRMENDSSSIYGAENSRQDQDQEFEYENEMESDRDSANGSSFQRRNSSKFGQPNLARQASKNSTGAAAPSPQLKHYPLTTPGDTADQASSLHIAPLLPFNNSSTPQLTPRGLNKTESKRYQVTTIDEEITTPAKAPKPSTPPADSFASIFTASLALENKKPESLNPFLTDEPILIESTMISEGRQKKPAPVVKIESKNPFIDEDDEASEELQNQSTKKKKHQAPSVPTIAVNAKSVNSSTIGVANDDDEDHIDWASSEDEAIVKQEVETFERRQIMRQSERRRLKPTVDLTSDLNSDADFKSNLSNSSSSSSSARIRHNNEQGPKANDMMSRRANMQIDLSQAPTEAHGGGQQSHQDDDIKTPDFDIDYAFQEHINEKNKLNNTNSTDSGAVSGNSNSGLPDLINQKGNKDKSTDKARKYLEGLDGVKFNEVQVPETLKKQLEYFDRDELLQLIAYQKKYLDFKESRIKDLENYIDNLVVKIIETEPLILMNASNVLTKSRNLI